MRGYFRVFGLTTHRLLFGITLVAMKMLVLRYWHFERDLPDPWGTFFGEPRLITGGSGLRRTERYSTRRGHSIWWRC